MRMKYKLLIAFALLGVLFLSGCNNPFDPEYERVCKEIYQRDLNNLAYYKSKTSELISELSTYKYYWVSPEDFIYEVGGDCMLIITNGEKPSYSFSFENEDIFPIRTLDIKTDQVEREGNNWNGTHRLWNYWLVCERRPRP